MNAQSCWFLALAVRRLAWDAAAVTAKVRDVHSVRSAAAGDGGAAGSDLLGEQILEVG
jgi:hypothetical protein